MGSATESNAKPQVAMADSDRKSLKKLLKVFFKKDKKKEKAKEEVFDPKATSAQTVENILEKIKQLDIKKETDSQVDDDELLNFSFKQVKDDTTAERPESLQDFTFKQVKDDVRADRSTSHSSDSGYSEKYVPDSDDEKERDDEKESDDVIDAFKQLNIEDGKKEKKFKTVVLPRGPIRKQSDLSKQTAPYYLQHTDNCRQIQINKHTLTGGQVIVNATRLPDSLEFDNAFHQVQQTSQYSQHEHGGDWLNIVTEVIQDDFTKSAPVEDILSEFLQTGEMQNESVILTPPHQPLQKTVPNAIEEFSNHVQYEMFGDLTDFTNLNDLAEPLSEKNPQYFLTPPHSINACSPMSDSASYKNSEYTYSPERSSTLSPERSSPICNSDYEKFQEIGPYDDLPAVTNEKKCRERKDSTSSMTMKQYKDLQKEISLSFSKKECCSLSRKTCKQIFQEYLQRLDSKDRKNICFKVAVLDLKDAYGVLQNVLISLSQGSEMEDLQLALFCLISERVLTQKPEWFVGDFGLNLLKSAALRCPHRPTIARYLVHCIRQVVRNDSALVEGRESVFHEVDALGDTLVIACARRGDACADALAEIARREPDELPLFRVNHVNADGASALHMACSEHSAASPRLHCVHILLEHAGADLWQGDAKAGDTALHMAVNSRTCDLHLIMVIFQHLDRKAWKKLAHAPNMCSTTPLENARSAMKSQTRDGYPAEVLEFLKKCR